MWHPRLFRLIGKRACNEIVASTHQRELPEQVECRNRTFLGASPKKSSAKSEDKSSTDDCGGKALGMEQRMKRECGMRTRGQKDRGGGVRCSWRRSKKVEQLPCLS